MSDIKHGKERQNCIFIQRPGAISQTQLWKTVFPDQKRVAPTLDAFPRVQMATFSAARMRSTDHVLRSSRARTWDSQTEREKNNLPSLCSLNCTFITSLYVFAVCLSRGAGCCLGCRAIKRASVSCLQTAAFWDPLPHPSAHACCERCENQRHEREEMFSCR